ncbi:MAG TPA: hypothetical protein VMT30_06145, partial [Candidatus Saccharimonadia bacterium]|nr:hypothetical protein [Candidatus Saccharimonadia bacterium]
MELLLQEKIQDGFPADADDARDKAGHVLSELKYYQFAAQASAYLSTEYAKYLTSIPVAAQPTAWITDTA